MMVTHFKDKWATNGTRREWYDTFISKPITRLDKRYLPAWSPFIFRDDKRANVNAIETWHLVFDVDKPFADMDAFVEKVHAAFGSSVVAHTTFSSTPDALRGRFVVPLDRAVSPEEFRLLWFYGRRALSLQEVIVDDTCKDPARLHYVPAVGPGGVYESRFIEGTPLEVDAPIAYQRGIADGERREREARGARFKPERLGRTGLEKMLKRAIEAVMSAVEGDRHRTLLVWTFRLAELPIARMTVEHAMVQAGRHACGDARRDEVERAVRYALTRGGGTNGR